MYTFILKYDILYRSVLKIKPAFYTEFIILVFFMYLKKYVPILSCVTSDLHSYTYYNPYFDEIEHVYTSINYEKYHIIKLQILQSTS